MNKSTLVCLTFFAFFLGNFCSYSQINQKEQQSLVSVLKLIENKYNISFSYADENLKTKELYLPPNNLSLTDLLWYLEEQTGLEFLILNESTIIIRANSENNGMPLQLLNEVIVSNYLTRGITLRTNGTTQIKPQGFGVLPG